VIATFGPRLLIVWDRLQAYRARATQRVLATHVEFYRSVPAGLCTGT
jgi:hypothetical protein